jgi:hypothetical protein
MARVYSCLQNGDILFILSCRNWYDNIKILLVNKQDKVSIFFSWISLDGVSCVPVCMAKPEKQALCENVFFFSFVPFYVVILSLGLILFFSFSLFSNTGIVHKRVFHGFRQTKRDDYFWVPFHHFWSKQYFLPSSKVCLLI